MTFEEYVLARGPALVRLARLLVGDPHQADDLAQDALARVYPRWRHIARSDRPDVYVRRVLVNLNHSWWRRRGRREVSVAEPAERRSIADAQHVTVERDAMWPLVAALPPRQRDTLVLRYYEDLDDVTIAEILGCSPVTVRTHAMRGLAALRVRLAPARVEENAP